MNVEDISAEYNISELVAQVLKEREIDTKEKLDIYFDDNMDNLHSPDDIPNINKVAQEIRTAALFGDNIMIFGDYDTDGTTATAVMYQALDRLGKNVNVDYMISDRYTGGYGLSKEEVDTMKDKDTDLLIMLDCGISNNESIKYAQDNGIEVIVIDHHENDGELPECLFVDLKVDQGDYPFSELCGCGVAWKVAQVVREEKLYHLLDLVTTATVGDMVPLLDENRLIVKEGLKRIRQKNNINPGLQKLIDLADVKNKDFQTHNFGFGVCPFINAPGRIDHAKKVVDLFVTKHDMKRTSLSFEIKKDNEERKSISDEVINDAIENADSEGNIVVYKGNMPRGVVGLIAGDLKEHFNKPAIVLGSDEKDEEDILKGSCRSIKPLNMYELLDDCSNLLEGYGGHKMAAGLSLLDNNFEKFKNKVKQLTEGIKYKEISYDLEISTNKIDIRLVDDINKLEPFGIGNQKPKFIIKDAKMKVMKRIGRNKSHLKGRINSINFIAFGEGENIEKYRNSKLNIVYSPDINYYRGKNLQLKIRDIIVKEDKNNNNPADQMSMF